MFVSMMENYERVTELAKEGLNAQGALAEANEIRVKSLAGQINILKDNLMSLMDGFTPVLYGGTQLANAILNVVNAIGTVPTATAIATQAFLSFNKTGQLLRDNLFAIAEGYSPMIKRANEYISTMEIEKTRLKDLIAQKKLDIEETKANIIAKKALNESTTQLNAKLKAEQTELKATQLQLAVATAKTVALQAVMSAGLSLAIGAIVGGLSHLVSNLNMSSEQMGDLTSRAKDLKDSLDVDISGLVSEYERLEKLAEDSTKTEKEKLYYHEEMAKVREELVAIDSGYAAILNDETKSLETQLNLIKAQREEKLKDEGAKLDKDLGFDWTHNNRVDSLEGDLKLQYDALLKYKELYDQIKGTDAKTVINPITGYEQSVDQFLNNFENMKEAFKENYAEADRLNGIIKVIGESGHESGKKMVEGLSQYDEMYNSLHKGTLDAVGASAEELNTTYKTVEDLTMGLRNTFESLSAGKLSYSDVLEDVRSAFQQIGSEAGVQEGIVEDFLNVFPKYSGAIEDTSDILALFGDKAVIELGKAQAEAKNFLETMKDAENYTPDLAEQLLEAYPELAGHIQDTAYVQEFLNDKIAEMDGLYGAVMSQVDVHRTAQEEILANDAEFWNQKMKNSENFVQYQNAIESKLIQMGADSLGIQYADFAAFVESKGGLRDVDYTNATNLAEAENMTEAQKLMSMLQNYVAYVNEKDGYRGVDSQLIADFLNWQGATEVQTVEELKQVWASFYNAKKAALQKEISQLTKFDETLHAYGEYDTSAYQASMQLQKLNKMNQQIMGATDLFGGIKTTFKGVGAKYNGGGGIGSSGLNTNPSSGSSNSGKDKQDTEQVVEDLELVIDRYYELNDAIDDVNNKLELNRQLQANAKDMNTVKKLHKEEIALLNEKVKAMEKLQLEQRNDMLDQKNQLSTAGFKFDKEGNITNYSSQLKAMQDYANSLKGEAKEAQIAYVQSIVEVIDAYTTLTNDSLPSTELALEQLQEEIEKVNKEHEKTIQLIETLGDRYYEINGQIADVDNKLALVRAKQENATPSERVKLMKEEIALMKQRQQLIAQQKSELETEANEIAKQLAEKGVEFNADGTIKNYKQLMENLTTVANQYVGDTRDEMVEDAESLLDLIEQYDDIIRETLPELAVEWEEYTSSIREAEKAMAEQVTEVQKNVTSAIENELQKRTEAVKKELEKQKDAYNKQFDEEDWEDSLSEEQRKLDEIQQAINNMSRDTSLAGQLKLQQLREEYEAQQKVIDDMIRDKEKENGNNRFDEEMEKLDEELEEALDPQNIADLVNKALVDGFVTIGDEVVALDSLMSDWLSETGDGLYAIGDTLREELIDNLRVAQELMAGMGIIQTGVSSVDQNALLKDAENQLSATLNTSGVKGQGQNLEIAIGSLLEVKGNVTEDVLPKLESMIETAKSELIEEITHEMMRR